MRTKPDKRVRWTPERLALARAMRRTGRSTRAIGHALGCTAKAVRMMLARYHEPRLRLRSKADPRIRLPQEAFAERARRLEAGLERDLTAELMGDPPPGYSALDARRV